MIVKMMGADGRSRQVYDRVISMAIEGDGAGFNLSLTFDGAPAASLPVTGQVFLMNEDGVTVDRFVPPSKE